MQQRLFGSFSVHKSHEDVYVVVRKAGWHHPVMFCCLVTGMTVKDSPRKLIIAITEAIANVTCFWCVEATGIT